MRKAKVIKRKKLTNNKAQLVEHIQKMEKELRAASDLISMLQNEIREVVILNKSMVRTIENLSKRDC